MVKLKVVPTGTPDTPPTEEKILNRKAFSELIMDYRKEYDLSAIDAVLKVCEDRQIDPEDVRRLIDNSVKGLIEQEALQLNMIKGSKASLEGFLE
jgi:hypothetical protein